MDTIYLDHNATTPVHPEVFEAMRPYLTSQFGNPSCLYPIGVDAGYAIEKARMYIAKLINAQDEEIVFTGCGTESDNMAVKGAVWASGKRHIVVSAVEHAAVGAACDFMEQYAGCRVTTLPVDGEGRVNPADAERAIGPDTAVVSVMMANNEIGTIQPVREIARIARSRGALMHTDAIQAVGRIPVDVEDLGVDLLSISGHKFYGPKGVGALYVRTGTPIAQTLNGGGQESGFRGGTENVAGIAGLGKAAQLARKELAQRMEHAARLRDAIWERINARCPGVLRNSPADGVLPGTLNVAFPGVNAREFVRAMGAEGVCVATGSACSSGKTSPSRTVKALGRSDEEAKSSIRISTGRGNTEEQIERLMELLPALLERCRQPAELPA